MEPGYWISVVTVIVLIAGAFLFAWLAGQVGAWWDWLAADDNAPFWQKALSFLPFVILLVFVQSIIFVMLAFTLIAIIGMFSGKK